MSFRMTGFKDMKQNVKALSRQMRDTSEEYLNDAGEQVVKVARENCPIDSGGLRESIRVVKSGIGQSRSAGGEFTSEARMSVSIEAGGPDVPHAAAVHENPSKYDPPTWQGKSVHFRVGGPKFIERALQSEAGWILTNLAKKVLPKMVMVVVSGFLLASIAVSRLDAQDLEGTPVVEESSDSDQQIGVFAAVWCKVVSHEEKENKAEEPTLDPVTGEPVEQPEMTSESSDFNGCDAGFAASLINRGRLHLVAVIGTSSVGTGFAWSFSKTGSRPMAAALGVMANYDSKGIYSDTLALTLGATVSLRGIDQ
jgi:hypothetical protein